MPIDFLVLDIECDPSCPIISGRPFLRTIGSIIDMKEGTIRFKFPLNKGMEHFPRKNMKLPFESVIRASCSFDSCSLGARLVDSTIQNPIGRIDVVLILVNNNYVPVDFLIMDIDCDPSCLIFWEDLFFALLVLSLI